MTLLYDLSRDTGEKTYLAQRYPEVVAKPERELRNWGAGLGDPLWTSRRSTVDELHGQMVQLYI